MNKLKEWDYIICVRYKQKNDCAHCPLMMDRENQICASNGIYNSAKQKWEKVADANEG